MAKQIFVNLPVKDLEKAKAFFASLGFGFNPQFTDQNAACMVIGGNICAMLLSEKFFKTFTKKELSDSSRSTEVINAISVGSRAEVDGIAEKAVGAGGRIHREPQDHGWMYAQSIEDLDGHLWEFFWMDENGAPKKAAQPETA